MSVFTLEKELANFIVKNPQVTARVLALLQADSDFKTLKGMIFKNSLLAHTLRVYLKKVKDSKASFISRGQWEEALGKDEKVDTNAYNNGKKLINEILEMRIGDKNSFNEELNRHLLDIKTKTFMHRNRENLENGDQLAFQEGLLRFAEECKQITIKANTKIVFKSLIDIIEQDAAEGSENIPLGIPFMDDHLNGGIGRQELTVLMAPSNAGKSMIAANIIAFIAKTLNLRGVLFSLEGKGLQFPKRIGCCLAGINYNKILRYKQLKHKEKKVKEFFTEEEIKRMENISEFHDEKRLVIYHQITDPYVESIIELIRAEYQAGGLDYMILDYVQITKSNLFFARRDEEVAHIMRSLEIICSELNLAGIVVSQMKTTATLDMYKEAQSGNPMPTPKIEDAGESKKIGDTAATIIAIARTIEERRNKQLRLVVLKARESRTDFQVQIIPDWDSANIFGGQVTFKGYVDDKMIEDKNANAKIATQLIGNLTKTSKDVIRSIILRSHDAVLITESAEKISNSQIKELQGQLLGISADLLNDLSGKNVSEILEKVEAVNSEFFKTANQEELKIAGDLTNIAMTGRRDATVPHIDILVKVIDGKSLSSLIKEKSSVIKNYISNKAKELI